MWRYLFFIGIFFSVSTAHAEEAKVIASIKPLHSLAAAVMEGSGDEPLLLVDGKSSPHTFHLRPSQARALQHADMVFYMGKAFESFLEKMLYTLPGTVRQISMDRASGITIHTVRLGVGFDSIEVEEGHYDDWEYYDMHLWLSPVNAKVMAAEIANRLSERYPAHKTLYEANAKKLSERLDALHVALQSRMKKLKGKPFVVFHDAYQYFEKSYDLEAVGSIMMHPEQALSAKHIAEIRSKIKTTGAACVFREPSFDARVVDNLLEGTSARSGVLDPEGALLVPGPELYFQLMEGIAAGLEKCLK